VLISRVLLFVRVSLFRQGMDSKAIKDLPPSLHTDVMYALCGQHIRKVPLFSTCTDVLLRHMVSHFFVETIPAVSW